MKRGRGMASLIGIALVGALACQAQWLNYRDPKIPRTRDGQPNLIAPAPRAANGKPDLSGMWRTVPTPRAEMQRLFGAFGLEKLAVPGDDPFEFNKHMINIMSDLKPEDDPIRPEYAPLLKRHLDDKNALDNPTTRCLPTGIPWVFALPDPYKIVQTPGLTLMLFQGEPVRQIYTDGRQHTPDADPAWYGYSVGQWEGDTFVVDTIGFNDKTWLDALGHPHSEALHLEEQFHRLDFGHMDLQLTFDDPKAYTRPVTLKYREVLAPDTDLLDYVCTENERDIKHLPK